jgi:hypothetical protein
MTINAVDCTGLSPSQITSLVNNGVKTVGRYLSRSTWKGLNVGEVANLKASGIQIFSIYESNPTTAGYFTADKGKSDALDAINLAKSLGQPEGTAIYFTVDYDAKSADFPAILAYFKNVKANLNGYKVGAYGSYTVLNYLHDNNAADYWFQTVAWSNGQHCSFLNIYQFQCDKTLGGVSVDYNNIEKADIGAWGKAQPKVDNGPAYRVIIPNTAFWQAKTLVTEFESRGFSCRGVALKTYGPTQQPVDSDPYQFVIDTFLNDAKQLVIELQTRGYGRTYGEPR